MKKRYVVAFDEAIKVVEKIQPGAGAFLRCEHPKDVRASLPPMYFVKVDGKDCGMAFPLDALKEWAKSEIDFCLLSTCGRMFCSTPSSSGSPKSRYCCPKHQQLAVRATGADRVRRWRERKKAKALI